jgi:hypothetical protein
MMKVNQLEKNDLTCENVALHSMFYSSKSSVSTYIARSQSHLIMWLKTLDSRLRDFMQNTVHVSKPLYERKVTNLHFYNPLKLLAKSTF